MALLTKLQNRAERSQRERGAVLVLTALVMILLLFIAAFATDLGAWYRQGQEQQRAADVGALNGVQAYDRAVKQYFQSLEAASPPRSVKNWGDLTTSETSEAEVTGMREAAETVVGLLETSGLTFSDSGSPSIAFDPTDISQISTWTITATDGTLVVITRSFQQTDVDSAGNPIYGRAISVDVQAPGEQYFSNILRDAPQIERSAESVLSNCGAECTRSIELDPPFAGFNAAGSGDGYKPLLYDRDNDLVNGYEQVWAVNHHVRSNSAGDIICMDTETQVSCGSWSIDGNGYNSGNRPVELLSNRVNKIYAPMTDRSDSSNLRGGVVCYDVERYQPCTTEFIDLWGSGAAQGGHTSTVGVWEWDNQLWVLSHHGTIACVTMSADASGGMQPCSGTNTWDTAIVGHSGTPTPTEKPRMGWGEIINGDELYIVQRDENSKPVFTCFDLGSKNNCWSGSGRRMIPTPHSYNRAESMGFFRYTTGGSVSGVCITEPQDNSHYCFDLNGNNGGSPLSGFSSELSAMGTSWQGSAHYWSNGLSGSLLEHRTFFSGGKSDMAGCWNWKTNATCGPIDMDVYVPGQKSTHGSGSNYVSTRAQSEEVEPYGMSTITPECIIGLGDQSIFYSFNPLTLSACVDTQINTEIFPCDCADGTSKRWGEIRMPADLLAEVNKLDGTVTDPATGIEYLTDEDLLANGGVLDLSGVPDTVPMLMLNLVIDAKLGVDDKPLWDSKKIFDLQIVVQPTLTS